MSQKNLNGISNNIVYFITIYTKFFQFIDFKIDVIMYWNVWVFHVRLTNDWFSWSSNICSCHVYNFESYFLFNQWNFIILLHTTHNMINLSLINLEVEKTKYRPTAITNCKIWLEWAQPFLKFYVCNSSYHYRCLHSWHWQ